MHATTSSPGGAPTARARVTSHTPGRLRVRLKRHGQHPELLHTVKRHLEDRVGLGRVQVSATTNSVLVHYDHQAHSSSDILLLLRDVGLLVEETARGLGEDLPEGVPGHSTTSTSIVDTLTDLDRRVAALTGHQVDLKLLFPVALGGLGAWQLVKRGFGFSEVPAYVLLWFAFDSFWKFHRRPTTSADADTDPTTLHQPDGKGCFEGGVITRA